MRLLFFIQVASLTFLFYTFALIWFPKPGLKGKPV